VYVVFKSRSVFEKPRKFSLFKCSCAKDNIQLPNHFLVIRLCIAGVEPDLNKCIHTRLRQAKIIRVRYMMRQTLCFDKSLVSRPCLGNHNEPLNVHHQKQHQVQRINHKPHSPIAAPPSLSLFQRSISSIISTPF
jgi:hypothetical protein